MSGDIVGVLLDLGCKEVIFSLNGNCLPPFKHLFRHTTYVHVFLDLTVSISNYLIEAIFKCLAFFFLFSRASLFCTSQEISKNEVTNACGYRVNVGFTGFSLWHW